MIEKGGHYGPHYATPAGGHIRADLWQAARLMARKLLGIDGKPEGRRRIIPGGTYDAHAAGWEAPTMPGEKKERPRLMGSQRTGVPAHGPDRCKG